MKRNLLIIVAVLFAVARHAAQTTIKARLDSVVLLMGKTTALHIEIVQDKATVGALLADRQDTLQAMVEIAARPKPDTVDLGNDRVQINRDIIIQSFDSGMYTLPPLAYVVGHDTFATSPITLKVLPVRVDSLKDIHEIKPVEPVPFKLLDWVPDFIADYWWAWLLLLLLLVAGAYAYFHWYRRGINPLKPARKRLPAYDEAMMNLQALKARQLWQNGQEKEYFTGLTDILRVYIDRRFHVNAVEMTSSQIIDTLKRNEETRAVNEQLSLILEMADFVKFAQARPLADDNEVAYQRAVNFVETTKPIEDVQDANEDTEKEEKP